MISLKVLSAAAILTLALPVIDSTPSHAQGRGWHGGGGGGWHRGGGGWGRGGGFAGGAIAGALIGGAIASQSYGYRGSYGYGGGYGYYGGGPYYGAYDGGGYDDGDVVEVAPGGGGGDVNYCIQTYKSYNPRTGTYLGYDGLRHACP